MYQEDQDQISGATYISDVVFDVVIANCFLYTLIAHAHLQGLPGVSLYCIIKAGCCTHLMKVTVMMATISVTLTSAATFATIVPDLGSKPVCSMAS